MAVLMKGKELAERLYKEIAEKTAKFSQMYAPPCLAVISAGDNPASKIYVENKISALERVGMRHRRYALGADVTQDELTTLVKTLNADTAVHGILVQLPLPSGIDSSAVIETVDPEKDVDGFTQTNLGKLFAGTPSFIPCTPQGIMEILGAADVRLTGSHAVIAGRSAIVGKPLAALLTNADATVTLCHSKTENLAAHTRQADILITAAGCPKLITAGMVKKGAVVIDVGINRIQDSTHPKGSRLVGDVDFEAVKETAGFITPVPGGVGPLTVAMAVKNTLQAALRQSAK